jgi:hypothetical protein
VPPRCTHDARIAQRETAAPRVTRIRRWLAAPERSEAKIA